jgi:hypothetical protein
MALVEKEIFFFSFSSSFIFNIDTLIAFGAIIFQTRHKEKKEYDARKTKNHLKTQATK